MKFEVSNRYVHQQETNNEACKKVTEVLVRNTVEEMDGLCFSYSKNLKKVTFEEGSRLKVLGAFFCADNSKITEINLPDSIEDLGGRGHCFHKMKNLTRIKLSANLKRFGSPLVRCCPKLEEMVYPGTVAEFNHLLDCNLEFNDYGFNSRLMVDKDVRVVCSDATVMLSKFGDISSEEGKLLYEGVKQVVMSGGKIVFNRVGNDMVRVA